MKHLLLVGAGHAHVEVLRAFGRRPVAGVRITVLTRDAQTLYSGMLPGVVAGAYARAEAEIELASLAGFARASLIVDEACGLDVAGRQVRRAGGPAIGYDLVSLDIGSTPAGGDAAPAVPVKPIGGFLDRYADLRARVASGRSRRIVLVGGGAGGVELMLALERGLRGVPAGSAVSFTLVAGETLLGSFPPAMRARLGATLGRRGIAVLAGARAVAVDGRGVTLADGRRIAADEVLWATEASPAPWIARSGLACDQAGFLSVDATLRACGRNDVFAAGDMVAFAAGGVARSGVYAVRAGPVLAGNLRAALTGAPLLPWRPQRRALAILSTADGSAVAAYGGISVEGRLAWWLKDRIDRRFIRRYRN